MRLECVREEEKILHRSPRTVLHQSFAEFGAEVVQALVLVGDAMLLAVQTRAETHANAFIVPTVRTEFRLVSHLVALHRNPTSRFGTIVDRFIPESIRRRAPRTP